MPRRRGSSRGALGSSLTSSLWKWTLLLVALILVNVIPGQQFQLPYLIMEDLVAVTDSATRMSDNGVASTSGSSTSPPCDSINSLNTNHNKHETYKHPLDSDDILKYYMDPEIYVRRRAFIKITDQHYDCPAALVETYEVAAKSVPEVLEAKNTSHYKSQSGEDKFVYDHFFKSPVFDAFQQGKSKNNIDQRPHYFIEIGGLDGVTLSNSYFFEFELGWGGVLVEGETLNYVQLEENRGQSRLISDRQSAVAPVTTVHMAICQEPRFLFMQGRGPTAQMAANPSGHQEGLRTTTVPCLPMRDVLSMSSRSVANDDNSPAVPQTIIPYVDFYSIDVEGAELEVITTHDYSAIPVHTLMIETRPRDERSYKNARLRRALFARGFCRYSNTVGHHNEVWINATWTEPKPRQ